MAFIFGLVIVLVAGIAITVLLTGVSIGTMFGIHKLAGDRLGESDYGQVNFDNIQKADMIDLIIRTAAIVAAPVLVLHILFFIINQLSFNFTYRHGYWVVPLLFVLHVAAIFAGMKFVLKLDHVRAGIVAGLVGVFYLFFYAFLMRSVLL